MYSEKSYQGFKFKSSPVATLVTKGFGLLIIWLSFDFLSRRLSPSWHRLPYMLLLAPLGLFLLAVGGTFLLNTCQIEILDGELRFRRFLAWKSVPVDSITRIRHLWAPGLYMRVNHAGKCYRIIFSPDDYKLRPHPLPVVVFLREACKRNEEKLNLTPET